MASLFDNAASDEPQKAAQFLLNRFADLVKEQGGREEPQRCTPMDLGRPAPGMTNTLTCGCGGQTRFHVPYFGEDEHPGSVSACAVCDLAIRWPRFRPPV